MLTDYSSRPTESPALIDALLRLFDGPQHREARRIADEGLGEDFGNNA